MRDETYLYEDTLLVAANALSDEYEWNIEDTLNLVKVLRGAGLVIREREPRKEDIVKGVSLNRVSNPTLTGGYASGGRVSRPLYYEYTPEGTLINDATSSGLNYVNKYGFTHPINEENEND